MAIYRKEEEVIGQLVLVLAGPCAEETRYHVRTVSKFSASHFLAWADELETMAEAQARILEGLRGRHNRNHFLLVLEAEQFLLLEEGGRPSPRARSRSRDLDAAGALLAVDTKNEPRHEPGPVFSSPVCASEQPGAGPTVPASSQPTAPTVSATLQPAAQTTVSAPRKGRTHTSRRQPQESHTPRASRSPP